MGLYCLSKKKATETFQHMTKAGIFCCDWHFKGKNRNVMILYDELWANTCVFLHIKLTSNEGVTGEPAEINNFHC